MTAGHDIPGDTDRPVGAWSADQRGFHSGVSRARRSRRGEATIAVACSASAIDHRTDGRACAANAESYRERRRSIAARILTLDPIAVPAGLKTTVIWGDEDRINPLDRARLESLGLPVHLLPRTGHLPQIEAVQRTNAIMYAALNDQSIDVGQDPFDEYGPSS